MGMQEWEMRSAAASESRKTEAKLETMKKKFKELKESTIGSIYDEKLEAEQKAENLQLTNEKLKHEIINMKKVLVDAVGWLQLLGNEHDWSNNYSVQLELQKFIKTTKILASSDSD